MRERPSVLFGKNKEADGTGRRATSEGKQIEAFTVAVKLLDIQAASTNGRLCYKWEHRPIPTLYTKLQSKYKETKEGGF